MNKSNHHFLCSILKVILLIALIFHSENTFSQYKDSTVTTSSEKTINTETKYTNFEFITLKPNPKRSGLFSACVPGLGQLYNKQYAKVALVFVGGVVIGGFVSSNYANYTKYRQAYIGMIDNNPETPDTFEDYSVDDVKLLRDGFRRYLEYSIIAGGVGYILNILDAFISAHLKTFDMSKDISMKLTPALNPRQIGVCLGFSIH